MEIDEIVWTSGKNKRKKSPFYSGKSSTSTGKSMWTHRLIYKHWKNMLPWPPAAPTARWGHIHWAAANRAAAEARSPANANGTRNGWQTVDSQYPLVNVYAIENGPVDLHGFTHYIKIVMFHSFYVSLPGRVSERKAFWLRLGKMSNRIL